MEGASSNWFLAECENSNWFLAECENGNVDSIRGVCVSDRTKSAGLVRAAREGHLNVVCALLDKGVCAFDSKCSAIQVAAEGGQIDIVNVLIANGKSDRYYTAALKAAVTANHDDVFNSLLQTDADLDGIIQLAVDSNATNIMRVLLSSIDTKVDNHIRQFGSTALQRAITQGHVGLVKLMLLDKRIAIPKEAVETAKLFRATTTQSGGDRNEDAMEETLGSPRTVLRKLAIASIEREMVTALTNELKARQKQISRQMLMAMRTVRRTTTMAFSTLNP